MNIIRLATHSYLNTNTNSPVSIGNVTNRTHTRLVSNKLHSLIPLQYYAMGSGLGRRNANRVENQNRSFIHNVSHIFPSGFHDTIASEANPLVFNNRSLPPNINQGIYNFSSFYTPYFIQHMVDYPVLRDYMQEYPDKIRQFHPSWITSGLDLPESEYQHPVTSLIEKMIGSNYTNKFHSPERMKSAIKDIDPVVKGIVYPAIDRIYQYPHEREVSSFNQAPEIPNYRHIGSMYRGNY